MIRGFERRPRRDTRWCSPALRHTARGVRRRVAAGALLGCWLALSPAQAQETTPEAEPAQKFQDWALRCQSAGQPAARNCYLFQNVMLKDGGQRLFHIAIGIPPGEDNAVAVLTTPLGTYLPPGVGLQVDEGDPVQVVLEHCNTSGCHAAVDLEPALLTRFKNGLKIVVSLHDATGRRVTFPVSLVGFTKGFEAMQEKVRSESSG